MTYTSVRRWLQAHTQIEPSLLDGPGLEAVVAERVSSLGAGEPAYIAELERSSDEVDLLIAAIAVPETSLFRYPRSFELLLQYFERRLAAGGPLLRALSIGCATGQEPYCIAMTALQSGWSADRVHVEGIDRNAQFLRAAESGVYGASSVRTEIPAWAVSYLRRDGDRISIDPAVRALVRFTRADVTAPSALLGSGPWDVVFCRNVLIYLNVVARGRLLDSISAELAPGGLQFVGHAEQLMRGASPLRPVNAPHAFALERADGAPAATGPHRAARRPADRLHAAPIVRPAAAPHASSRADTMQRPEQSIEAARELADSGRAPDAERMIREIIARSGPSAPAVELLGMIRMSVDDSPGAKPLFEQALYLDPGRPASLVQLALISERAGDAGRAASYWDRARRASESAAPERRA